MPDDFNAKLNSIEQSGKARFGNDWDVSMQALKRAVPGGIPPADMAQIAAQPDPANTLMWLGRHQLMAEASDGNAESERAFTKIRQAERKAHSESKGRVWKE
jgi:hypothetical protein